jgi:probable addiction module antidote protein
LNCNDLLGLGEVPKIRSKAGKRTKKGKTGQNTEESLLAQLNQCLAKGNYPAFLAAVLPLLQERGVLSVSRDLKLQREALYRSFNGRRRPRFDTVCRVLRTLGYSVEVKSAATGNRPAVPNKQSAP